MAATSRRGKVDNREKSFNPRTLQPFTINDNTVEIIPDYDERHPSDMAFEKSGREDSHSNNISSVGNNVPARDHIPHWMVTSKEDCIQIHSNSIPVNSSKYCNATWDNMMCWPWTHPGNKTFLPCPRLMGVDFTKFAYRECSVDGLWLDKNGEEQGIGWTNYTNCFIPEVRTFLNKLYSGSEEEAQLKYLVAIRSRAVELTGLILTLVALLLSLFIFYYFKKLHNNRTRIHKNLFVAMLLQVIVRLVFYVDQAIVKGDSLGLASSIATDRHGIDNTPIICEAFYVVLEYSRSAMFMWMFIEAMYLNNLISVAFFQGPSSYRSYYLIGWGIPVIMISIWAIVMGIWDTNDHCWTGYSFKSFYWILEGPRFIVIGANLLFLLNIMRILVTKLREANSSEAQHIRPLRRSVRNALFLVPLLGITNAITMIPQPLERSAFAFGIYSYATNLLTSFQGFVVACIYCFFNADIKRIFWRIKVTLRPSRKSKNGTIPAFPNQDVFHSKGKGPKLHYKAHTRSYSERHVSIAPNLQHLHPAHLSAVYDQPFLDATTKPAESPFIHPASSL